MKSFLFNTIKSLVVEFDGAKDIGALLRRHYPALARVCIVTDRLLLATGLLEPPIANLKGNGWDVLVIDDVVADPPEAVVLAAEARAREWQAELILGFGGGSSMDVAKLIAVLLGSDQPLGEMYGIGKVKGPRLPLVLVPTTAGTGSEATAISVVTTGGTTKSGVVSPVLYADLALLDAKLTLDLPAKITAATGIDAMVHAIEAFTSVHLKNPISDLLAKKALQLLSANIVEACHNGHNRAAREAMLLGAALAGQAFSNAPVAAVHALAYPLGGHFHIPHGLSNALLLTHVLRFNVEAASAHYAELADCLPETPAPDADRIARAEFFIASLESLIKATGCPLTMREVGIAEKDLPLLAREAMKQQRLLVNNPRDVTEADAFQIYSEAL